LNPRLDRFPLRIIGDFQPLAIAVNHPLLKLCRIEVAPLPASALIIVVVIILVLVLSAIARSCLILGQGGGGSGKKESEHARDRRNVMHFAHSVSKFVAALHVLCMDPNRQSGRSRG
jgi:hypothetical protein